MEAIMTRIGSFLSLASCLMVANVLGDETAEAA